MSHSANMASDRRHQLHRKTVSTGRPQPTHPSSARLLVSEAATSRSSGGAKSRAQLVRPHRSCRPQEHSRTRGPKHRAYWGRCYADTGSPTPDESLRACNPSQLVRHPLDQSGLPTLSSIAPRIFWSAALASSLISSSALAALTSSVGTTLVTSVPVHWAIFSNRSRWSIGLPM